MSYKIIGTGLSGLVGSRIIELNPEYQFVDASLNTGIDILNQFQLEKYFIDNNDAQIVLHLAAYTDTNSAWNQKEDQNGPCYLVNVVGTENIAKLCQKYNKYLIYISTDFVFDGNKKTSYSEDDIPNPIEWYGQTKYLGEQIIKNLNIKHSIVRFSYPYRVNFEDKSDIVRKIISKLKNNETINMFTDQITTPTFIDDIANGLKYFFINQPLGIFHLTGSSSQSPYDMAKLIASTLSLNSNLIKSSSLIDFMNSQPQGSRPWQKNLIMSNQKITKLGIKMKTLKEALQFFLPHE